MQWRPEINVEEIPAPQKIAPYAVAVSAEVVVGDIEVGNGRLVLLHDPSGNPSWDGEFRCVSYVRAETDSEMVADPLLTDVGWSWLLESLNRQQAEYRAPSGTVTAVSSKSFGEIADDPISAQIELRASWTPELTHADQVSRHFAAWADLLCLCAGMPPLPDGVVPITQHRTGSRLR